MRNINAIALSCMNCCVIICYIYLCHATIYINHKFFILIISHLNAYFRKIPFNIVDKRKYYSITKFFYSIIRFPCITKSHIMVKVVIILYSIFQILICIRDFLLFCIAH